MRLLFVFLGTSVKRESGKKDIAMWRRRNAAEPS